MSKQENGSLSKNDSGYLYRRSLSAIVAVSAAAGIMLAGCVTAAENIEKAEKSGNATQYPAKVPAFGPAVAKELASNGKRVTMVFAVDENGQVQAFRSPETRAFTARDLEKRPLKADSIAAFESLAIIKTTNPKVCWTGSNGTLWCVCYPDKNGVWPTDAVCR
jgi:hypothetical protein